MGTVRTTLIWLLLAGTLQAQGVVRQIDITQFGILPNRRGITKPLQALINSQPDGTVFYAPNGVYLLEDTIRVNKALFTLQGDGKAQGENVGTIFAGSFAGPLFDYTNDKTFRVSGIGFHNRHSNGLGIWLHKSQQSAIENCGFKCGGTGLRVDQCHALAIAQCYFRDCGRGAAIHGNFSILSSQFIGNQEGLWLAHHGAYVHQLRCEVNGVAMRIGLDPEGKRVGTTTFDITALRFEANDKAIVMHNGGTGSIGNFGVYGTTNAPSGSSDIGIEILGNQNKVSWHNFDVSGHYRTGGVVIREEVLDAQIEFRQAGVGNRHGGVNNPDMAWRAEVNKQLVRLNPAQMPNAIFQLCNLDQAHPVVVDLIGPKGIAETRTPTFEWSVIPDAVSYQLKVSDDIFGSRPLIFSKSYLTTNSFTSPIELQLGLSYKWQVRAQMADGSWSDWRAATFKVSAIAK